MVSTSVAAYEWTGEQRKNASRAMGAQTVFVTSRNIPRGRGTIMGTVNFLLHPAFRTHYKNAPHRSVFKRITPQQRFFCTLEPIAGRYRSLSTSPPSRGCLLKNNAASCSGSCGVYSSPFFKQKKPSVIPRRRGAAKKRGSFFRFIHNFSAIRNGGCFHARLPSRILVPVFSPAKRLSVEVPCF